MERNPTAFDPQDLVPVPVFCCDSRGRFVWVNHHAERLTGYSQADLQGKQFWMLIAPSKRKELSSFFLRESRRDDMESERDLPLLTREGRTVWVGVRARRVQTLQGEPSVVASAHDLHDMVFEIERLHRLVRDLQNKTLEATGAARLRGDFLGAMSREIRTPMDGILGMTQLLLESHLDRNQRMLVEVLHDAGGQLLDLVTSILDFSNIEAGKLEVSSLGFDVRVTVDGVVSAVTSSANRKSVTVSRNVHHDVPSNLKGDPGRLRQVLNHLLRILVHSMDRGEISVWTTLIAETPHDATVRFTINYAGHTSSVDLEELTRVFGTDLLKCRRMDAEALQVAISRELILLMGGTTGVEMQSRGGSLWFEAPFKRQDLQAPAAPLPSVNLAGMRVLVADASMATRMAVTELLSQWGCVPDEVEDGEFALTLLREAVRQGRPYRVALIDLQLPALDGEGLARAIRAEKDLDETLLMAITAVGRRGDAARAQEIGYSAYLVKPFEPTHLYDALVEVVHRGAPAAEASLDGGSSSIVTRHSVVEKRRQRLNILVVDDDMVNQLVAVAALRRAGYQPKTAATSSEALQAHALHRFDLIFMDLELPDMDGTEATAEIHRIETTQGLRETPVVAITAHDRPEVHKRCLAAGMKQVLVKPPDLEAMVEGIDRWTQPDMPAIARAPTEAADPTPAIVRGFDESDPDRLQLVELTPGGNPTPATLRIVGPSAQPVPEVHEPALDFVRLESSCMGNAELKGILIQTFMTHIRPRLQRLRDMTSSGDARAVEFEAHGLKGMSATIGAVTCADVFARIERLGREQRLEPVGPMLDLAEIEVARVEEIVASMELKADAA